MPNNENEIPKVNKDFTVSHDAEAAQIPVEELERRNAIAALKDKDAQEQLDQMLKARDKDIQQAEENIDKLHDQQIREAAQAEMDKDKQHRFTMFKEQKTPAQFYNEQKEGMRRDQEIERSSLIAGVAMTWGGQIDEGIEQAQSREAVHDREQRETFQKDAEESRDIQGEFREAHDERGGEEEWQSLKADRDAQAQNDGKEM